METVKVRESIAKKKQPGRPKKAIKKSNVIVVRLTPAEYILIKNKAAEAGLKLSVWFRLAAKNAHIVPRLSTDEMSFLRSLSGMGNNLNQLTKLAHQQGLISLTMKIRAILEQIDLLNQKLAAHDW